MSDAPSPDFTRVREVPDPRLPALVHGDWRRWFPWLVQGTTTRGEDGGFDLGLFGTGSADALVRSHWVALVDATGAKRAVHARQVHEATVRHHVLSGRGGGANGSGAGTHGIPTLVEPCDGHITREEGALLAVTVADCVPVFVVDPAKRAVGALHAGWRGAAAGVLEAGLGRMESSFGTRPADVHVHFGPSICGTCYEVGLEVFEALDQPVPSRAAAIDLRTVVAARAVAAGVDPGRITISMHCTRCTDSDLFSHRGGDAARQVGYVGILA